MLEIITCACGCGKFLEKYSREGRERRFALGHNSLGRPVSVETRKKISESERGKKQTPAAIVKIKAARKKQVMPRGEDAFAWRGGKTPEHLSIRASVETRLWREAVFSRDGWTCRACGERGGIVLHAHHILGFAEYPDLRFAIDNGVTMCKKCHMGFHNKYGRRGFSSEDLKEYIKIFEGVIANG